MKTSQSRAHSAKVMLFRKFRPCLQIKHILDFYVTLQLQSQMMMQPLQHAVEQTMEILQLFLQYLPYTSMSAFYVTIFLMLRFTQLVPVAYVL